MATNRCGRRNPDTRPARPAPCGPDERLAQNQLPVRRPRHHTASVLVGASHRMPRSVRRPCAWSVYWIALGVTANVNANVLYTSAARGTARAPSLTGDRWRRSKRETLPIYRRWGFWHNDVELKEDAVRPVRWTLQHCPELRLRALLGSGLDAQIVGALAGSSEP